MANCMPVYLCDLCSWRGDSLSDMKLHVGTYHYGTTYLFELVCLQCNFRLGQAQSSTDHQELTTAMDAHLEYLHGRPGSYTVERKIVLKPRRAHRMRGAPVHLLDYILW